MSQSQVGDWNGEENFITKRIVRTSSTNIALERGVPSLKNDLPLHRHWSSLERDSEALDSPKPCQKRDLEIEFRIETVCDLSPNLRTFSMCTHR